MNDEKETRPITGTAINAETDSFLPGAVSRHALINHCDHVRSVLIANRKRAYVYGLLDPAINAVAEGWNEQTKKNLQQAVLKCLNDYSDLFFNDPILFLT